MRNLTMLIVLVLTMTACGHVEDPIESQEQDSYFCSEFPPEGRNWSLNSTGKVASNSTMNVMLPSVDKYIIFFPETTSIESFQHQWKVSPHYQDGCYPEDCDIHLEWATGREDISCLLIEPQRELDEKYSLSFVENSDLVEYHIYTHQSP